MKYEFQNLRELREELLGYRQAFVARKSELSMERLEAIEAGEPAGLWELERLAKLFGLDPDVLEEDAPYRISSGDAIGALTSVDEFRSVGDETRWRIVQAASAARDAQTLTEGGGWEEFARSTPRLTSRDKNLQPHRAGAALAQRLRKQLSLGDRPIESMRDLVAEHFPAVTVLYADLGDVGPAGLAFCDRVRGPSIVLNTSGKNRNPCVRRLSLAHEMCHLLHDWNRQQPIATISGYFNDSSIELERRANAFAVRFLCPESVLRTLDAKSSPQEVSNALRPYGLPYGAAQLYLRNEAGSLDSGQLPDLGDPKWTFAEEPYGLRDFPLANVPLERRTAVARAAAAAYASGRLRRDKFSEYLGVTAVEPLEQVLDFFALSTPAEGLDESA